MPQVQAAVAQYFGKTPLCSLDPDQVVALGAAQQASRLVQGGGNNDWLLVDVIPLSLGLETMGGLAEKLIPRNSPIPCSFAQEFTTFRDGQSAISIHIVQGERELVSDCRSLGRFELRGIPPMVAGAARVRVRFDVDADGLLTVTAEEVNSGARAEVQVRPSVGLNEGEIAAMLTAAIENARSDTLHRQLLEARVSAEQLLATCYAALEEDGKLLSPEEFQVLSAALATLKGLVDGDDEARLRQALQQCQEASNLLAARRMDKTIRQALKGKNVEAVLKP
jgi:molecular chaperone HscA